MKHRGVYYDTGTVFRGPGYEMPTRRRPLDMSVVQRELEIIRDDLHANAVRVKTRLADQARKRTMMW
jgi:hypothetical protein